MTLDLSFAEVCEIVKKEGKRDSKLIEAVDALLGLTMVCSPVLVGPAALALLPFLTAKNELVKIGKLVFVKLSKKKELDYLARQQHMQVAYGLLCFTAFFDALDEQIPKALRDRIGLLGEDKAIIAKSARKATAERADCPIESPRATETSNPLAALALPFPHPTESLARQIERHAAMWKQMGDGFLHFIQKLAFWDDLSDADRTEISSAISKVPEEAAKHFEAQYFQLACSYHEFAIWASIREHKITKELVAELAEFVRKHAALSQNGKKSIDIGFTRLHDAVLSIPEMVKVSQSAQLVESLTRHYKARVEETIFEGKEDLEEGKPRLLFPRVCDAFIPQSFRVLRHSGKTVRLEDELTWKDLTNRPDLGAFMLSYLSSPYSTETPMLILGQPGSGKSLLTKVLSAQLMSKQFTVIRVPLREVNAEAGIVAQIEETIRRITNISVDSWATLTGAFKNSPLLVILDGYDELLQASGQVFSGYLKDVQDFQKYQTEQGRPVRVIVTSRVTLIDKATIPPGSTVLRLLEFNDGQRERWISIWNSTNASYFREAQIDPFSLPDEKDPGAEKILSLAEQPLLLLMLALYDSEDNQLRKSKALDRTKLYDSLLRLFVRRELGKEKEFEHESASAQGEAIRTEMKRLGVAALGMYNRRKVHILAPELNDDIKFFNVERSENAKPGKAPLSQADLLLGSFFFVHKSKAQHTAGAPEYHQETSAFEFLHNTFGEFLTADFILRRALAEVEQLKALQESEVLRAQLEQRLGGADGFQREWFASLVYTPLFTRPVVLEMMREWVGHVLKEKGISRQDFVLHLEAIILNQIKRLLTKREMPSIIRKETAQEGYRAPFGDHPLLGHIAIYSINLVLLRVIVGDEPFVFDEGQIGKHEDGARPWDRLTHVWRSWFALDNLNGVTAVLLATRQDSKVVVSAKEKFQVAAGEGHSRLQTYMNVAASLGDNISRGLAGLLLFDPLKQDLSELEDIAERLGSERIDLIFQIAMRRLLWNEERVEGGKAEQFWDSAGEAWNAALHGRGEDLEQVCLSIRRGIRRMSHGSFWQRVPSGAIADAFRKSFDPREAFEVAMANPSAALLLYQMAKEVGDLEWRYEFRRRYLELGFRRHHPFELFERSPEAAVAWVQLVRELGKETFLQHLDPEFFERLFHPRYLLELSERNPEAALAWVQLARELGGDGYIRHLGREFIERAFHPEYLLELSERNPEAAVAWIQLVRELRGEDHILRLGPDFIKRGLHRHNLLELMERNPNMALAWLQLGRELGDDELLRQLDPRILEHALHPRHLIELSQRSPEAALGWIRLAQELGGKRLASDLLERILHSRHLLDYVLELNERNPEAALAWLQLAEELGGGRLLRQLNPELLERALHPRYLSQLADRNPEAALAWIQVVRELGGAGSLKRELFVQVFHPRRLVDHVMELSERSPEVALAWVELAQELGGEDLVKRFEPEAFEHAFSSLTLDRLLHRKPAAFAVALRLVRVLQSRSAAGSLAECLSSSRGRLGAASSHISHLPLSALSDLRWLAAYTDSPFVDAAVASIVRGGDPGETDDPTPSTQGPPI